MALPSSDIRRIFAFAMAGGLGLGVLVYGFVRLVEGSAQPDWTRSALFAALVGACCGLVIFLAVKLALGQAAHELQRYAVALTEAALPAPAPLADDFQTMRTTLRSALASRPDQDALPRLALALGATPEPDQALEQAAVQLARHLPVEGAVLLVVDHERAALVPAAVWGLARIDGAAIFDLDGAAIGRALRDNRMTTYSGLQVRELLPLQRGPEALTLFCFPQRVGGQPFGTLCLLAPGNDIPLSEEQQAFASGVAELLTLAVQYGLNSARFRREGERLAAFEQLEGHLAGCQGLERALEQVLRVAAELSDSTHGTLLLVEPDEEHIRYRVTLQEGTLLPLSITAAPILRHGLAGWALRERRADIVEDTERDARWLPIPGLDAMRSVLVVPLLHGDRAIGVLTLADPAPRHYSRRTLALCSALAAYAVVLLSRLQYHELVAPAEAERARRLFGPHVSATTLAQLLADPQALRDSLRPQLRELAVLCIGLRGQERLEPAPELLIDQLFSPCVSALAAIGYEHQAAVTVREDGSVLLLFGFPTPAGDARVRALRAAQAVQQTARRLRGRWRTQFGQDVTISAGLAVGPVLTGALGDERYGAMASIGGALAEAARLQRLARPDEVLLTDALAASFSAEGLFPLERLAPLTAGEDDAPRPVYRLAPGRG